MGLLDDQINIDGEAFTDTDAFGETVTYTPAGGQAVTIKAVVVRDPPEAQDVIGNVRTPVMDVWIRNDSTYGRTSINTGGDTITVAYRNGGTTAAYAVRHVLDQDNGMWHLRIR